MPKTPDLHDAYAVETPEDSLKLYAGWADSYDESFASEMDYQSPRRVAEAYVTAGGRGNVLDVGAGTGLVGEALRDLGVSPIHALDLSPEMLEVARGKGVYEQLMTGDLTGRLDIPSESFDGVVSAGTFTSGHVGPDALDELIRVARPGAQFVITIHERHFQSMGFAAKLNALASQIQGLSLPKVPAYGEDAQGQHKDDCVHLAQFVRA